MHDSQPVHAICGRISVRCVTQPLENSWFVVDFKNLYISPTYYSIRHYISWDTEALRNWVLEGSFDGIIWSTIRAHRDDESISHKGITVTWELRTKGARYRAFRIRQTGLNSNKHFYLSCSGFEIYGEVYQIAHSQSKINDTSLESNNEVADPTLTGYVPWDDSGNDDSNENNMIAKQPTVQTTTSMQSTDVNNAPSSVADEESQDMALLYEIARQEKQRLIHHLSGGNGYEFQHVKDFDDNGILYFLGTDWRTQPWRNPADMGVVTVTSSRLAQDSVPANHICGRSLARCVCMAEKNNWFMVDFRNLYVRPSKYSIKHYDSWDTECLRNWVLEATNDLKKFKTILEHKKDKSLNGKGSTFTWDLDTKGKRYRAFRIRQTGHNSNKHWYLACSGLEFYGEIFFKPE